MMAQLTASMPKRNSRRSFLGFDSIGLILVTVMAGMLWLLTETVGVGLALWFLVPACAGIAGLFLLSIGYHLDCTRTVSAIEVEFGGRITQQLTCRPRNALSRLAAGLILIEVVDESVVPGMDTAGFVGAVGADGTCVDVRDANCRRWGEFTQGPTQIRIADRFGFFERRQVGGAGVGVVVLPPVVSLPSCWLDRLLFRDHPTLQALLADDPQSRRRPQPPLISGTRPYRPGDPTRLLYDREYARTMDYRSLRTVTFARPPALLRIWLAVDCADTVLFSQQALAVAALALAGHWLRYPEVEVAVLTGRFGQTELVSGGATPDSQLRHIQQILAGTTPVPAAARTELLNQLTSQVGSSLSGQWQHALAIEAVVALTAARTTTAWQTVLSSLDEQGIVSAVVDGSMRGQGWPVPMIDLLPTYLPNAQPPTSLEEWARVVHPLTEPSTADSFKLRAIG